MTPLCLEMRRYIVLRLKAYVSVIRSLVSLAPLFETSCMVCFDLFLCTLEGLLCCFQLSFAKTPFYVLSYIFARLLVAI